MINESKPAPTQNSAVKDAEEILEQFAEDYALMAAERAEEADQ